MRRAVDWRKCGWAAMVCWGLAAGPVRAQNPPVAPDDTPSIRVGATLFADYSYTVSPEAQDVDGNSFHPSAFISLAGQAVAIV